MDKKRREFLKFTMFVILSIPIIGLLGKLKPFQKIMNQFKEQTEEEVY